jgi:flagellar motor switch protein FliM
VNDDIGQPLLSAEETSALLDVMRSGASPQHQVQSVDLGSPERFLRNALLLSDQCARSVAKEFVKLTIRYSGYQLQAEDLPSEIVPYKMVAATFSRGSIAALFMTRENGFALVILGQSVVSFLLDRRLGAPLNVEQPGPTPPRSSMSSLELRVIEPFAVAIAEAFFKRWCDNPKIARLERIISDTEALPVIAEFEPLLQVRLRIPSPYCAGDNVIIALSSAAVRETFKREAHAAPIDVNPADRARLVTLLKEVMIKTVAILGETQSTVGVVLSLKAGDIIRLDNAPAQPINLCVRGTLVAKGIPVVQYGNVGIQVFETVQGGTR